MNLLYAYEVMTAADEQRHGFIKLYGMQADHEVRLMAQAKLVEATFDDGKEGSFTSINSVTATGQAFLRVFKNVPMPSPILYFPSLAAEFTKPSPGNLRSGNSLCFDDLVSNSVTNQARD